MNTSVLSPLVDRIFRRRTRRHGADQAGCPHCEGQHPSWPIGLWKHGAPNVCTGCAGVTDAAGEPLIVSNRTGGLVLKSSEEKLQQVPATPAAVPGQLDSLAGKRIQEALAAKRSISSPARLTRYLTQIQLAVGERQPRELLFIDLGEPALASLACGWIVISLGLLATLEDEAQLAFVLGRELCLERAGWPQRRFSSALAAKPSRFGWISGAEDPLVEAIETSLRLGFGPAVENTADRESLALIVRAGYDPAASATALRLLEAASLSGRGGRFLLAADRAVWLETAGRNLAIESHARLNREVYRRAVGGFRVYAF